MHSQNNKIKVLFIQDTFGKLSEAFIYRINVGLKAVDVHVLSGEYMNRDAFPFDESRLTLWHQAGFFQKLRGRVNATLGLSGSHSGIGYKIIDEVNRSDADVVCFQFAYLPVNIGMDLQKIRKKTCILHHGSDVNMALENGAYRKRLQKVWQTVDEAIFVSHFLEGVALTLGCPKEKSVVNYLGVPVIQNRKIVSKEDKPFEFICVARLTPVKNHIRLIQAFDKVVKALHDNVTLTLIGAGELRSSIEEEIKKLGLETKVKMLGGLTNDKVLPLVQEADCIVLVSQVNVQKGRGREEEGMPISLLEGASIGLPMIGSRTGGIPEIIADGVNGYLVDPLDINNMASAMIKVAKEPLQSRMLGEEARKTVIEKFDIALQFKKFEGIFEELAEGSSHDNTL